VNATRPQLWFCAPCSKLQRGGSRKKLTASPPSPITTSAGRNPQNHDTSSAATSIEPYGSCSGPSRRSANQRTRIAIAMASRAHP
jgi:hypothetical protein